MKRRSLWWLIVYHGRAVGGMHKVEIKGELLLSAEEATQRILRIPGGREKKEQQAVDPKRKTLTDELEDLKNRRGPGLIHLCP